MTEEKRKQTFIIAQEDAYESMQLYMKHQYYFCDEDWDEEQEYIKGAYLYRIWNKLYEEVSSHCEHLSATFLTEDVVLTKLRECNLPLFYKHEGPITSEGLEAILAMFAEATTTSYSVVKKLIEDYYKEKVAYEMITIACREALEKVLTENKALFDIDITSFNPHSFYGYVTFVENTDIGLDYPTTLATIVEDTEKAISSLKAGQ